MLQLDINRIERDHLSLVITIMIQKRNKHVLSRTWSNDETAGDGISWVAEHSLEYQQHLALHPDGASDSLILKLIIISWFLLRSFIDRFFSILSISRSPAFNSLRFHR